VGGSAKPRRRKAASSALQYEHQPGRRSSGNKPEKKGEYVFGCLIALGIAAVLILFALIDTLWGDGTWKWAAESWPGGAYSFAVFLGALAPCVATLLVRSLSRMDWKSHRARALGRTILAVACGALLVPYVSLVFNAQDNGKWGRGPSTSPSWVFSNHPWLWAVGLLSTIATLTLLVLALIARNHHRDSISGTNRADNPVQDMSSDTA
jgi:hypothetical protein